MSRYQSRTKRRRSPKCENTTVGLYLGQVLFLQKTEKFWTVGGALLTSHDHRACVNIHGTKRACEARHPVQNERAPQVRRVPASGTQKGRHTPLGSGQAHSHAEPLAVSLNTTLTERIHEVGRRSMKGSVAYFMIHIESLTIRKMWKKHRMLAHFTPTPNTDS